VLGPVPGPGLQARCTDSVGLLGHDRPVGPRSTCSE
jgi:hypothetical protein